MKYNLKTFSFLILLVLLVLVVFSVVLKKKPNEPQHNMQTVELISPIDRQNRIDHVRSTNGEGYRHISFGDDRTFIVTYYQINRDLIGIPPEQRKQLIEQGLRDQGVLIFEEKESKGLELFWESSETDIYLPIPILGSYDLTGDGINEIVVLWQNGRYERMFVYKYLNGEFDLLSPYYDFKWHDNTVTKELAFNAEDSLIKIIDIDNDQVPEIEVRRSISLGLMKDGLTNRTHTVYRAYKWSGTEYILWKEEDSPFTSDGRDEYSVVHVIDRLE